MGFKKNPGIWAVTSGPFQQTDNELLETGNLADAEVECAKRTWKVHKIILCSRSDWFKKALMGPFEEGQTGKVTITDFKPAEVDCLLKFVYTGVINLQNSFPEEDTWPVLIKIWKMADFFCLGILRDLVIQAAKDCSREMALVFCAFDAPKGHDQNKTYLFHRDFVPAVKAIYGDELEGLKQHFAPIILGLAVASVHTFSQIAGFEKLLQDIPQFSADWATALMKGLSVPSWCSDWGDTDKCSQCDKPLYGSGILDTFTFMQRSCSFVVCGVCYGGPDLEIWRSRNSQGGVS